MEVVANALVQHSTEEPFIATPYVFVMCAVDTCSWIIVENACYWIDVVGVASFQQHHRLYSWQGLSVRYHAAMLVASVQQWVAFLNPKRVCVIAIGKGRKQIWQACSVVERKIEVAALANLPLYLHVWVYQQAVSG